MRPERAFDRQTVDRLRSSPALGRREDDHWPAGTFLDALGPGSVLDGLDLLDRGVERRGHGLVHLHGLVALDEVRRPAVAAKQLLQLLARDPGKEGRVGDLVPVEVQDRQHGAVRRGIEELVGMPRRGERSGLRLAVADDAGDDEIRIVEDGAERVAERVAQLATLVDRPRALGRRVAGDPSRERELETELLEPRLVLADVGIDLAVRALEVRVAHDGRTAVSGTGHVDHVEVVLLDDPVQVDVDEVLPGRRAPVPQQHALHVLRDQGAFQQRIVVEIDLADRQVVGSAPVSVHRAEQLRSESVRCHRLTSKAPGASSCPAPAPAVVVRSTCAARATSSPPASAPRSTTSVSASSGQ